MKWLLFKSIFVGVFVAAGVAWLTNPSWQTVLYMGIGTAVGTAVYGLVKRLFFRKK